MHIGAMHYFKRETLQASIKQGGLNAPSVKALNDTIKYKHLLRCLSTRHPKGNCTKVKLQKVQFNLQSQLVKSRQDKSYLDQAINTHNTLRKLFDSYRVYHEFKLNLRKSSE